MKTVPVIRLYHLTDERRRAYTLAHNKLAMNTDFDLLQSKLTGTAELDMGLFGSGPVAVTADVQEDDFKPELPEEPVTRSGDIRLLGRLTKSKEHPTMKQVKLFDCQIQNNTKGQDIICDGFAGSGTTILACEQNGRTAYYMEHDPK